MRRKLQILVLALLAIFTLGSLTLHSSKKESTCLFCRATLVEGRRFHIPYRKVRMSTYSDLVLSKSPDHEHAWRWSGSTKSWSFVSVALGCGRRHPIWGLPVEVQSMYAVIFGETALKEALLKIDSGDQTLAQDTIEALYEKVLDSR